MREMKRRAIIFVASWTLNAIETMEIALDYISTNVQPHTYRRTANDEE